MQFKVKDYNAEREKSQQQLIMIAGALQTIDHLIQSVNPEVSLEEEIEDNLSLDKEK